MSVNVNRGSGSRISDILDELSKQQVACKRCHSVLAEDFLKVMGDAPACECKKSKSKSNRYRRTLLFVKNHEHTRQHVVDFFCVLYHAQLVLLAESARTSKRTSCPQDSM